MINGASDLQRHNWYVVERSCTTYLVYLARSVGSADVLGYSHHNLELAFRRCTVLDTRFPLAQRPGTWVLYSCDRSTGDDCRVRHGGNAVLLRLFN